MPLLSLISTSFTNLGITGKAAKGVSVPREYSFPSQTGNASNGYISYSFPASIGEKNMGNNDQYKTIYVKSVNSAANRILYWNILHQTTTTADFVADSGSFGAHNWEFEIGRFGITTTKDSTTEGNEFFQIEIREDSPTGPVVLTSPLVTLNDTSQTPTYAFDSTNPTSLDEGDVYFSGQAYEFRVLTNNVDGGTYLYYTMTSTTADVTRNSATADIGYYATDLDQSLMNDGRLYIYGYTGSLYPQGWGKMVIYGRNDVKTEGNETFQIQLRTDSVTGPIVATSPPITILDTSITQLPIASSFQYQVIGGGAGGPTTRPGGGGGGGGFATGTMSWSSAYNNTNWTVVVGSGGAPLTSGTDSYLRSVTAGGGFTFYGRGGGRGATTTTAGYWGGGGGGGSGNGAGSNTWLAYGQNQWDNQYGSNIVTASATNRQASSGGAAGGPYTAGGGGGAGGAGGAGTYGTSAAGGGAPGIGGAGKANWLGVVCGVGGGGVNLAGTQGARSNGNTSQSGIAPGEAGQYDGYGQRGAVIIRYPDTYRPASTASNATITITGGYRYYVWTTTGGYFQMAP